MGETFSNTTLDNEFGHWNKLSVTIVVDVIIFYSIGKLYILPLITKYCVMRETNHLTCTGRFKLIATAHC